MQVLAVQESLEYDMELLCLTGVEDKLQVDVRPTLELLRNAAIRVCTAHISFVKTLLWKQNSHITTN